METTFFITLAYGITGTLLMLLCIITVMRARSVNRQIQLRREL